MAKTMKRITVAFVILTVLFALIRTVTNNGAVHSAVITLSTVTYHLAMRLAVGKCVDAFFHNRMDYNKRWFAVGRGELRFYNLIRVRKWKGKMPTYDTAAFDPRMHTWEEIAGATCQSEVVHEIIAVLSFLPIVTGVWLGAIPVFIVTSLLSAGFDCLFVIMQRYNRPRIIKVIKRQQYKRGITENGS